MKNKFDRTVSCLVDHKKYGLVDGVFLGDLDGPLKALIRQDFPKATNNDFICSEHLVHYRLLKMDQMIAKDYRQNNKLNRKLTRVMEKDAYQMVDVREQLEHSLTFGQKVADAVAHFGGSWPF
ncbi:MAG: cyclic nucleotide-binding protein, partial [Liquorilactobacillus nagelii]